MSSTPGRQIGDRGPLLPLSHRLLIECRSDCRGVSSSLDYFVSLDGSPPGNAKAIEAGFPLLAHGSTYVLVSVVKDHISFSDAEFHKREARIVGSRNALKSDFEGVMDAIREGRIDTGALLSAEIALADLPSRFAALAADREGLIKAVVRP